MLQELNLPERHLALVERFVEVCQADARVVAAFLGGSYASRKADLYSDVDLGVITTDEAYEEFLAERSAFVQRLGEAIFLEDFDLPHNVFFIFADDIEGELAIGCESQFENIHGGPFRVLIDKKGILAGVVFPWHQADQVEQLEVLRRQIAWFWHDLSHFITAMGRGQLWWAQGQLEVLRRICVNLARLQQDFSAAVEDYDKLEQAVAMDVLSPLLATFVPLEEKAMLRAALVIVEYYRGIAPELARAYGLDYLDGLERVMCNRLERLCETRFSKN